MEALELLEYRFNTDLQLRHVRTGEEFKFIDQDNYEQVADAVADYIQEAMEKDYDMLRLELPFVEHLKESPEYCDQLEASLVRCPIFMSSNCKGSDTVLLLLCGTGRVAAGQWARKLCINDSLKTGSVLPFLDWAKENSFGAIVYNPNKNVVRTAEDSRVFIPFNNCAEAHVNYVWEAICQDLQAKHFILVAHSYGGISSCDLLRNQGDVLERLRCIAFTDAALSTQVMSEAAMKFLSNHCINWVTSLEPLDTILSRSQDSGMQEAVSDVKRQKRSYFERLRARDSICKVVSANTNAHENTTMSAFPSICKFFIEQLQLAGAPVGLKRNHEGF